MNKIKAIGYGLATAVTFATSSCTTQKLIKWANESFIYISKSGIKADEFLKGDSIIEYGTGPLVDYTKAWADEAKKIEKLKAVDSTKTAVIDTLLKYNPNLKIPESLRVPLEIKMTPQVKKCALRNVGNLAPQETELKVKQESFFKSLFTSKNK